MGGVEGPKEAQSLGALPWVNTALVSHLSPLSQPEPACKSAIFPLYANYGVCTHLYSLSEREALTSSRTGKELCSYHAKLDTHFITNAISTSKARFSPGFWLGGNVHGSFATWLIVILVTHSHVHTSIPPPLQWLSGKNSSITNIGVCGSNPGVVRIIFFLLLVVGKHI